MPLLKIQTNQAVSREHQEKLLRELTAMVASGLGKPAHYVQVVCETEIPMSFAGTTEPTAVVELRSLGLPAGKTQVLSATICGLIADSLEVPTNRTFINFFELRRDYWGWDGRTFA
ncbi:MAG: hypothetical protein H7A45_05470 [Verrucomicrobiales bacterium]|nr:hypothetical protein [Verrucomicrobiales bacterium]